MANRNGIIINVGFDSDIKEYINRIETQLQTIDWEKVIGLSDSFDKEYEKITKSLQALKKEVSQLGATDVAQLQNNLNSITQTTNRLTRQFDALVSSLPIDIQAKMNKSLGGIMTTLEAIGEVGTAATKSIVDVNEAINNVKVDDSQYVRLRDRLSEIQKLLNGKALNTKLEMGTLLNKDDYKNFETAKQALQNMYNTYNELVNQFNSNPKEFKATEELKKVFFNLQAMLNDIIIEFDPKGIDGVLENVLQIDKYNNNKALKDRLKGTYGDVAQIIKKEYSAIYSQLKQEKESIIAEATQLGYNLSEVVKSGAKDTKKGNVETINFNLPIVIDPESETKIQEDLKKFIEKTQVFANENPLHLAIDLSSKYKVNLEKKTLGKIQEQVEEIQNQIAEAKNSGKEDWGTQSYIAGLENKMASLQELMDKMNKDISKVYSIEIGVHTEWATKQVSVFVEKAKEQLQTLKENVVLGPEITLDDNFTKQLEESTKKAIEKLQEYTGKIETSLSAIKDFFTNGTGMTDEQFLQAEKKALGTLYINLKTVREEVDKISAAFKLMNQEADDDVKNSIIKAIDDAVNVVSEQLGTELSERLSKEFEIKIKNKDILDDALRDIELDINDIFSNQKIDDWEAKFLKAINNIQSAFQSLLDIKNQLMIVPDYQNVFDAKKLNELTPYLERFIEVSNVLTQSLAGINGLNTEIRPSVVVDSALITQAIISALNSTIINVNTDMISEAIYSAVNSAPINISTGSAYVDISELSSIINTALDQHYANISETIRSSIASLDLTAISEAVNLALNNSSIQVDGNVIIDAIRTAIDVSTITSTINSALQKSSINIDSTTITQAIQSAIDLSPITESIKLLPFDELQNSLQQIISILQIKNQSPENLQSYINIIDQEIAEYQNKLDILKSATSVSKPESIRNSTDSDQFPRINSISEAIVDALQNTAVNINYEPLREIISNAIVEAILNKDSAVTSVEGLSKIVDSVIKPHSVDNGKDLTNAISSGIQQALNVGGNGLDLISYMAKDIALSDKAIIHNGRTIDKEDVEAILKYYGVTTGNNTALVTKAAGKKVVDTIVKQIEDFTIKASTEHGGVLTNDLKLYGLSGADATHSTDFSNPEIWRKAGVDISKGILSVIHSHAGDEYWVPSVADFRNAVSVKGMSPFSTTLARQQISVMDTAKVADVFKNYKDSDWTALSKEVDDLAKKIIAEGFKNVPDAIREKANQLIKMNTYGSATDPEAHKRNTVTLPAHYAATEMLLRKKFNVGLDSFSQLYGLDEFAKKNPYGLGSIVNTSVSSSYKKPRSISSSEYDNSDDDIQAAIKINEEKIKELVEKRELIVRLMENISNDQNNSIAKMFDFDSVNLGTISSLTDFLKVFAQTISKLANDDSISKVSKNISTLTTAFTNIPANNELLKQLDTILAKSKELQVLSDVLKSGSKNIAAAERGVNTKSGTATLLSEDEKYIKELTSLYFTEQGSQLFSIENLKATKDNLVEITALIRDAEGEAKKVKLVLNNDSTFTTKESKNAEKAVSQIERTQQAEAEAAARAAEQALNRPNELMDALILKAKQIPRVLNSAFNGNAVADQDIVKTFTELQTIFNELQNTPNELIDKDKLTATMSYITGEFDTVINRLNKINTSNKDVAFNETLSGLISQLKEIQGLVGNGKFEEAKNAVSSFASELNELGGSQKDSVVVKISQVDKLLGKINDELAKNPSMPGKLKGQFKDLAQYLESVKNQYEGGLIPKQVYDDAVNKFANLDKQAKGAYNSITSMFKRSAMSIARMYLSWYRWISYIRQGITEITNMDTALTKMSYTMNVTDTQLKNMSNQMVQMAKDLSSSVSNIEQIYQIYANLQTSQEELEKTAKPTAILANLSGVDAATAADQIQAVLNQFELTADATEHIVDVYDKISASIKVDYSKGIASMAEAVQTVGNFANQAGLSFEQLSAIVGRVMQQTRQDGTAIGTALKTIMTRVSKASKLAEDGEVDSTTLSQASKALKQYANIDVYTPAGEFREFDTIMTELAAKWNELSDAEQSNISFAIAATRQKFVSTYSNVRYRIYLIAGNA